MKCPFCNEILENGYCRRCQRQIHELYRHPKKHNANTDDDVLEPEIVDENDSGRQSHQNPYGHDSGRGGFRQSPLFAHYTFNTVNINNSCLTGMISLALIFFVFLQMGFLAALGFAFFTAVGKVIAFFITVKSLLNGKIIPPLVLDAAIWIMAYCLVSWLS